MTDFLGAAAGDTVTTGYVRVTFEESLFASLAHGLETRTGDSSYFIAAMHALMDPLASGSTDGLEFLTPVNGVDVAPGDRVAVQDFKAFARDGITFAVLASRLNAADGLTVHTVEWLGASAAAVTPAVRATTVQKKNAEIAAESPLDTLVRYLKNAGIAVLVVIVAIVALVLFQHARPFL